MFAVMRSSWALFLGVALLLTGNSLQGSLLGLRGGIEGFDPGMMGWVMSGYFAGFMIGSRLTPVLLKRVGHVRVFAAFGSLISAAFVVYASVVDPLAWTLMRFVVGICFSGVYVVAESWLNDASTNSTRGQALSGYMIAQMVGIIAGQAMLNVADPGGYDLFVLMSVVVSLSFAPMLLSVSPAPLFKSAQPMSIGALFRTSPLGCIGTFLLGGVFSAMFGMGAVFTSMAGMSVAQTSIVIAMLYVGGLVLQYPIGWLSDRMDRRKLIAACCAVGAAASAVGMQYGEHYVVLLGVMAVIGGMVNPLYSLIIAYTNDFLEPERMASASGGLVFLNGVGAMGGPLVVGYAMRALGPYAYFVFIGVLLAAILCYALYRMTRRAAPAAQDTGRFAAIPVRSTQVVAEIAAGYAVTEHADASKEKTE